MRLAGDYLCDGPTCDGIAADDGWQPAGWTHTQDGRDLCASCSRLAAAGQLDDTPRLPPVTAQAPAVSVPAVRELVELLTGEYGRLEVHPAPSRIMRLELDPEWLAAEVVALDDAGGRVWAAPGEVATESWCLAWCDLDIDGTLRD